jgi:penicillin-binding protein 1A
MSLNTVSVRLAMEVSPKTVIATAHRLGVASDLRPDASIALGTSEVTPLELVNAYAPFANGGVGVQPHIIAKVRRADGKQLYQRKGSSFGRVIEPQYVGMMNAMLQETLVTGTARKAELPGWQAAGKTGTSQDYRDAWFVGYTSQLVAGVWLGNDDGSATKRARFFNRLAQRGIDAAVVERITCPIGVAGIPGKQPEVLAVAVVAQLLQRAAVQPA